ncbi:MAG TPA: RsmB/NOP family class I SAM-dependent RNA methyltransferase [Stellaceae bacterium]|nr:RsmB/NOP family class I SAM-dependent RNA methyltransferase [Stellaceae bacterium]
MTPGARIEAAIQLLDTVERGRAPADDTVANYFRRHRFAGVKDRAAISEHIYAVLRFRASLDWWLARMAPSLAAHGRTRLLVALVLVQGWSPDAVKAACDGDRFRPPRLSGDEERLIDMIAGGKLVHRDMPPDVVGNYPAWLRPHLEAALGRNLAREAEALNQPAALDLRANLLKSDRDKAGAALARERIEAVRTKFSPLGLRVFERIPLSTLAIFKSGGIEVQDEGSQLAALLVAAKPGMRVADFCAGAGGKTLALAASMGNRGHLVACDVSALRLERATQRLRRAGASIVQRQPLSGQRDKWVKRHAASFDRVLIDAPCTGTGTWRRNPDAKWRLRPQDLSELTALQADILDSAARLVKPGGRLVYVTCSLLREEDEGQVEKFLAVHPDFSLMPIADVWGEAVGGECPTREPTLRLSPARHGTDGFFVAVMVRALAPDAAAPDDKA